ncbi:hypothetical protein Acsp04_05410 [Actinomadura sp. NBRC 104425]|nr:hypothetical protein Acsp04_05410 [Actinomadura sp. NBRC 104425]
MGRSGGGLSTKVHLACEQGDTPWAVLERQEGLGSGVECDIYTELQEALASHRNAPLPPDRQAASGPVCRRGESAAAPGRGTLRRQSHHRRPLGEPIPATRRGRHARSHPAGRIAAPTGRRRVSRRR